MILALLDSWQAKEPPLLDAAALFLFFHLFTFLYLNAIDIWHTPSEIRPRFFARFIDLRCNGFCKRAFSLTQWDCRLGLPKNAGTVFPLDLPAGSGLPSLLELREIRNLTFEEKKKKKEK